MGIVSGGSVGSSSSGDSDVAGIDGWAAPFYKVGSAAEAAGQYYCYAKDAGMPGAWAPGTPGLTGRATDGTAAGDAGCLNFKNPASGSNYVTNFVAASNVAQLHFLIDILWVNSGTVVSTLGEQAINSVAFPARDANGSTNGEGVEVGILVTASSTNVGVITNTTLRYTNSANVDTRTATIAAYPATAIIGTLVPFQLAAGDKGVRSIQGVTLGTSYGGGSISLIAFRRIAFAPSPIVNVGGLIPNSSKTGVKVYNGSCLIPAYLATATTATTTHGIVVIEER